MLEKTQFQHIKIKVNTIDLRQIFLDKCPNYFALYRSTTLLRKWFSGNVILYCL